MAKIVVLDDRKAICDAIESCLVTHGHQVRTASTGADAIDQGYLFEPDLLITDWDLESDYDGYEVAEAVSHAKAGIKTILITGCPERPESHFQFDVKIPKPFTIQLLLEKVNQVLAMPMNDCLFR